MKPMKWTLPMLVVFLFFCCLLPRKAEGHGTDYRILDARPAVAVAFIYSDNQPMRYAEVLVFSPQTDDFEYQNGRTDMNGRFVFYPDVPGKWRIQADDGTGHLERVSIDIATGEDGEAGWGVIGDQSHSHDHGHFHNGLSRLWGVILGISFIVNLFMGFYLFKSRRS